MGGPKDAQHWSFLMRTPMAFGYPNVWKVHVSNLLTCCGQETWFPASLPFNQLNGSDRFGGSKDRLVGSFRMESDIVDDTYFEIITSC